MTEPQYLIRLPWPPKELSANTRKRHLHATDKRAKYKSDCQYATKAVGAKIAADALLRVTFHPPDDRKRDLDNMLSAVKYGLDGVALAAGVDDYGWSFTIDRGPKVKDGCVLIQVGGER